MISFWKTVNIIHTEATIFYIELLLKVVFIKMIT